MLRRLLLGARLAPQMWMALLQLLARQSVDCDACGVDWHARLPRGPMLLQSLLALLLLVVALRVQPLQEASAALVFVGGGGIGP